MSERQVVEERLSSTWTKVSQDFDLGASKVKPGVKQGRSRKAKLDCYISFKSADNLNIGFAVFRMGDSDPLCCGVHLRDTNRSSTWAEPERVYKFEEFAEAERDFVGVLETLGVSRRH